MKYKTFLLALLIVAGIQTTWANNDLLEIKTADKLYVQIPNEIHVPEGYELSVKHGNLEQIADGQYIFSTTEYGNYSFKLRHIESDETSIVDAMVWREPWPGLGKDEMGRLYLNYQNTDYPKQYKVKIQSFTIAIENSFIEFDADNMSEYELFLLQHDAKDISYSNIQLYDPKTEIRIYTKTIVH